jgi:hypothetical protein
MAVMKHLYFQQFGDLKDLSISLSDFRFIPHFFRAAIDLEY